MSDLVAKVEAMAARARDKAEENRKRMPIVAAFVDEMKEAFGADQVKVTFASEGGVVMGRKDTDVGVRVSDMVIGPYATTVSVLEGSSSDRRKRR